MEQHHAAALDHAISAARFDTFLRVADGDRERARKLYVWDRDLASAILADLAIVEVALRNAVNEALTAMYGSEWYRHEIGLDDRLRRQLAQAWRRLPRDRHDPGHVVAQLMFGFWTDILDAGGTVGALPQQWPARHEELWRGGLRRAFPGGRAEAERTAGRFTRHWVHQQVQLVHTLRNRAAHHEPLLGGIPRPGQRQAAVPRFSAQEGHDGYLLVLRLIDRDLAEWVAQQSAVPAVIAAAP
ncbi:hypothetical protein [Cellulomonas sp. NPDC089187]|uniref:hypothetical protein n=1 Tax=Cellulomonas sp. NPDC089187 TaxID=3154970 RepID=UPI00343578A6